MLISESEGLVGFVNPKPRCKILRSRGFGELNNCIASIGTGIMVRIEVSKLRRRVMAERSSCESVEAGTECSRPRVVRTGAISGPLADGDCPPRDPAETSHTELARDE
jgi:hypothetical protein